MTGEHTINVWNRRVRYSLRVRRNITILTGDSGTGKSKMIKLIEDYDDSKELSGVHLECDKRCVHLQGRYWKYLLERINDSIVFIDENDVCLRDRDLAHEIKNTDNYYVIITRRNLSELPYSINEIYGLKVTNKVVSTGQVYNEQYMLYGKNLTEAGITPDIVITEDSNSGHDFFNKVCSMYGKRCESAKGKSKIKNLIGQIDDKKVLIIADGAAFGNEMKDVVLALNNCSNYFLYLPESFEWLLLKAGTIGNNKIGNNKLSEILDSPSDYVDSQKFFSWERFFTDLICEECKKLPGKVSYSKSRLHSFFMQSTNIDKVLAAMNSIIFK